MKNKPLLQPTLRRRPPKAVWTGTILAILTLAIVGCGGGKPDAPDSQTLAAFVADVNSQMPMPMKGMTLMRLELTPEGVIYEYRVENAAETFQAMRAETDKVEAMFVDGLMKAPDTRAMVQLAVSCGRGVGYRYVDPAAPDTAFFLLPAARLAAALEKTK